MNESSRSKGVKNVLSLQVARERTRQAKAASDRQISKRSNQRLLERLKPRMHSFGTVLLFLAISFALPPYFIYRKFYSTRLC